MYRSLKQPVVGLSQASCETSTICETTLMDHKNSAYINAKCIFIRYFNLCCVMMISKQGAETFKITVANEKMRVE